MTSTQLKDTLRKHPRQSLVGALLLVGLVGALNHMYSGSPPRRAAASAPVAAPDATARAEAVAAEELAAKAALSTSLWNTLRRKGGIAATQAFSFDSSYYVAVAAPAASENAGAGAEARGQTRVATAAPEVLTPAERLRQQAAALKVESIVMAEVPLVVIDGHIYRVGDLVLSFRVAAITSRQVVLQQGDLKITLALRK